MEVGVAVNFCDGLLLPPPPVHMKMVFPLRKRMIGMNWGSTEIQGANIYAK